MAGEFWLSDRQWAALAPLLPTNQPGARRVDDRPAISGIARARVMIGLANRAYNIRRYVWLSRKAAPA